MAHFVEHLIFKGTAHRRSWHILNRMENVGGELNAYTAKEETTVYAVFLEEPLSRPAELLCDLVLHSQFPAQEIEREVEVILDEINSYKDNPAELIYDEFENLFFQDMPLGHNILENGRITSFYLSRRTSFFETAVYPFEYGVLFYGTYAF